MERKTIRRKRKVMTFTKFWFKAILITSLIDLQLVFVLAFLDKINIAENLGICICTEILGVFIAYCCKSYKETQQEEDIRYQRDLNGISDNNPVG